MKEVLLLNANMMPISWLPISSVSWQNAVRLLWLDVIDVLHAYEDWQVHSPSMVLQVPSVVKLREQVSGFHNNWVIREAYPRAHLVFLRDKFFCQYCLKQFARRHLTLDHVIPRKYGGRTVWSNLTSACCDCNNRRGSDYLIKPASKPFRPTFGQLLKNLRGFPIHVPDPNWNLYLNWHPDLVCLTQKHRNNADFVNEYGLFEYF